MAEDSQRNFRSIYYEKVGFRGVEEKKSLEILLKDDRLGILPLHQETHALVMMSRKEQYYNLHRALKVIRFINESTPKIEVFLHMHQLESGKLSRSQTYPLEPDDEVFLAIASTMEEMVDDDVDCYWLIRSFVNHLDAKYRDSQPHLPKAFEHYLNLEDNRLVTHLKTCYALDKLPYDLWFKKCFAGCLPESSLQRVWDKVVSGSCKILVFVAVEIFLTFKMKVMALNNADNIKAFLGKIPQDNTDAIVSKAIDLWHKHCGTPAHSV
ncbi:hypothetical protein FKM82_006412 [Ascaphus truei]